MSLGLVGGVALSKMILAGVAGRAAQAVTKEVLVNLLEDSSDELMMKYGVHVLAGVAGIGAGVFVNNRINGFINNADKAIKLMKLMQEEGLTPEEQQEELLKIILGVKETTKEEAES